VTELATILEEKSIKPLSTEIIELEDCFGDEEVDGLMSKESDGDETP
jgi:hypothetical protein